jgi:small subunit ribosomal protein S18
MTSAPPRRRPPGKFRKPRRKVCMFCVEKANAVEWKAVSKIRKFVTERGKMVPRRTSGNCARHQRMVSAAIKRARHMALIPYVSE